MMKLGDEVEAKERKKHGGKKCDGRVVEEIRLELEGGQKERRKLKYWETGC